MRLMTKCLAGWLLLSLAPLAWAASLPSWNPGPSRTAIEQFVARVTDPASADFVPAAQRIAVFDNDGTLWSEKPAYFQLLFAMERVEQLAPQHPEWASTQPFQAVLEGDMAALAESGEHGLLELVMATHAGMTTTEGADRPRLDRRGTPSALRPPLHRAGVPAHARIARLSARP
jgi:hypothetical protein